MCVSSINFKFQGRATDQAVNCRVLIRKAGVPYQTTAYKIHGG